jgi:hypothetical protein
MGFAYILFQFHCVLNVKIIPQIDSNNRRWPSGIIQIKKDPKYPGISYCFAKTS